MEEIESIKKLLIDTGLNNRPGSLLYSANHTLKKGDWYFLGSNPGGSSNQFENPEEDTIENHLLRKNENFNEFSEGIWFARGKPQPPGLHTHQKRIKQLFADLPPDLKTVCSSNISFVRTVDEDSYDNNLRKVDEELCWQVHKFILSLVKPRFVICNGKRANDFFKNKMIVNEYCEIELKPNPQRKICTLNVGAIEADKLKLEKVFLFSVPHLSRFSYFPRSSEWIKEKIKS
ncbi:MAG: hypothetical protein ACON4F_05790 [Candidatus Puniceispirillaceae bacterium]